ncbi:hypothetical protein L596_025097 [Steinernema carpocapsae]|uniref:Uncharacterized protein n=1 Tax=Steinernema carpocapsae TaxID=34508 RepID=A0A4U5M6S7_STECR|nr:hypothetical protein L596_025097 [Steinernema carpocapsae]
MLHSTALDRFEKDHSYEFTRLLCKLPHFAEFSQQCLTACADVIRPFYFLVYHNYQNLSVKQFIAESKENPSMPLEMLFFPLKFAYEVLTLEGVLLRLEQNSPQMPDNEKNAIAKLYLNKRKIEIESIRPILEDTLFGNKDAIKLFLYLLISDVMAGFSDYFWALSFHEQKVKIEVELCRHMDKYQGFRLVKVHEGVDKVKTCVETIGQMWTDYSLKKREEELAKKAKISRKKAEATPKRGCVKKATRRGEKKKRTLELSNHKRLRDDEGKEVGPDKNEK